MPSSTVSLVAWDPESPAHVSRMFQQRVACGWKSDCVEGWRDLQREGKMAIRWVVLSDDDDDGASKGAKVLTLDTLSNTSMGKETFEEMGLPEPKISNQDWYERRGYKAWKLMRGDIRWNDSGNKDWFLDRSRLDEKGGCLDRKVAGFTAGYARLKTQVDR